MDDHGLARIEEAVPTTIFQRHFCSFFIDLDSPNYRLNEEPLPRHII